MGWLLLLLALFVYFIPAYIAHARLHHNAGAITVLNVFLGWTILGWVIALVWAMTLRPPKDDPDAGLSPRW
jgi:hypothetical protein